ncbi:hypothetical protein GBF35_25885 [Nonomuraea phyllanthi]|uniref:hypothetical protein n=1 Tax=Nonomuraea phyllanthi TaxID=2219224 RepID=UPI001292F704|nr:hypothetical protein [Nonomuraea phyllanthi]QFY09627.1 hypothetical protein GBF35_25885 [Nonomuraea phyllanthi]
MYEEPWIVDESWPDDEPARRGQVLWPVEIDGRLHYDCAKPDCERGVPHGVAHCCTACAFAAERRYEIDKHSPGCDERWEQRRPYVDAHRPSW